MKYEDFEARLEQVLSGEFASALPNMISQIDDGYDVFGLYIIRPTDHVCQVIRNGELKESFSSLRVALSWCIAEKYQKYSLARDIKFLDQENHIMQQDVKARRMLMSSLRDRQRYIVAHDKLEHKEYQLKQVRERLSKCVHLAKYFQLRGFNDEIARTRRPTPNRTTYPSARKPKRQTH